MKSESINCVLLILISTVSISVCEDSHCPGTTCLPAPGGTHCTASYDRDDGCCPAWTCDNGQTVYGKAHSSSSGSNSFSSSFSSFGGGPGAPGAVVFPGMPGPLLLPFFGRR